MGVTVYLVGVAVNWPINFALLRRQDRRNCTGADGVLDRLKYRELRKQRLLYLPTQEVGALGCYALCSVPILFASRVWPRLFGPITGAALSLFPAALQWYMVKHYERFSGAALGRKSESGKG